MLNPRFLFLTLFALLSPHLAGTQQRGALPRCRLEPPEISRGAGRAAAEGDLARRHHAPFSYLCVSTLRGFEISFFSLDPPRAFFFHPLRFSYTPQPTGVPSTLTRTLQHTITPCNTL